MIQITLKIEEFSPGKVHVNASCPRMEATPLEVHLAERIRVAIGQEMNGPNSKGSLVISPEGTTRIEPIDPK